MNSVPAHISTTFQDGILVITVIDERLTDMHQSTAWQDQMAEAIRRERPSGVVLDMKNVQYMTSVAVLPLVATRSLVDELKAKLILCNLSPTVLKVLTITQLIVESRQHVRHLAMAETLEDAITALGGHN